jgi:WD40-like Beta Propeller Repeat
MSTAERLEHRLPELLAELAQPAVPDYFDDMLRAAERTRQRPAWASLERLLPMNVSARPAPLGLPSWRPIVLLVAVATLLVALAVTLLAGARPTLPPEFGPARNGLVLYGNTTGDIMSLDPVTGDAAVLIGGATDDLDPYLSPDGRTILFVRITDGVPMLYTANVDGSGVKAFAPAKDADWNDWSLDSHKLVYIAEGGGTPYIRDVATDTVTPVPVRAPVQKAYWLSSTELLLVVQSEGGDHSAYSTINVDGTEQRPLLLPDACCGGSVLAGRGLLAWTSWNTINGMKGRTHVYDISNGQDRLLESTNDAQSIFLNPRFSPDGTWLAVEHLDAAGVRLAIISADGRGTPVDLEPTFEGVTAMEATFSPDGTQLLVTYGDGSAWLYSVPDGNGAEVEWPGVVRASWQRLVPER